MILPLILALMTEAPAQAAPVAPPPREIAEGVSLIPGAILPNYGPDGNTVIFDAPQGLVVIDTGRHAWHSDAILAFAAARGRPVAAIVNTHWHLDHSSGNRRIKAVFPAAPVYTTNAVDRALANGGFLVRNLDAFRARLDDPSVSEAEKSEIRVLLDTMDARDTLRPDVTLARSQRMRLAGRSFDVRVTDGAVSDSDVWLYDRRTRVAVLGDLVTFPAPFFETACADDWRRALDEVWATRFIMAIPGHGEPMNRDQFNAYRTAFNGFMDCVQSDAAPAQCATVWTTGVSQFLPDDAARRQAAAYAEYYVGYLRPNGGDSPDCLANPR